MPRYFLEVCYKGTRYSGLQLQENAISVQFEVEKALNVLLRLPQAELGDPKGREGIKLFVSSRTDAGVHALQNFFHFDTGFVFIPKHIYNLNALLPGDIAIVNIYPVDAEAHCRFDAISREYKYYTYQKKDPFLEDRAYYYPFKPDINRLNELAVLLIGKEDFSAFSKRKTKVKTFTCAIHQSEWREEDGCLVYYVKGNRFLRGMVKGLVATMLKCAKTGDAAESFKSIIASKDCTQADFSAPSHGLFLVKVNYKEGVLTGVI
ncbi:MAG TPA: tRNA pseudouridine(38-40) synthase TruA [Chitinophagaceae bacterium]|nr:tRNA pseudouridine(38-40) synthase TruA [Chitinophagaceae bacterium]